MNLFKKTLLASALGFVALSASADPIYLSVGDFDSANIIAGDANGETGVFDAFNFSSTNVTSAYYTETGTISNGTLVFDSGSVSFSSLDLYDAADQNDNEFFNNATQTRYWTLTMNYDLVGSTFIVDQAPGGTAGVFDSGDLLTAFFTGGQMDFVVDIFEYDVNAGAFQNTSSEIIMSSAVEGTTYNDQNGVNFTIFGSPINVADDTIFFENAVQGLYDLNDVVADPIANELVTIDAKLLIANADGVPTNQTYNPSQFVLDFFAENQMQMDDEAWYLRSTNVNGQVEINVVSAPGTIGVLGAGLLLLAARRRMAK